MTALPIELTTHQRQALRDHLARIVVLLVAWYNWSKRSLARVLEVGESTVRAWCQRGRDLISGTARQPGRPAKVVDVHMRNDVIGALHAAAGRLSVRELKAAYPDIPRARLEQLKKKYRRVTRKLQARRQARLEWHEPGAVWAMDHGDLPEGIEGHGREMLIVRDLGSGRTLHAGPAGTDANSVCSALEGLIARCGAPLCIKADNGSGFVAEQTKGLLAMHGVLTLYSPPGTPAYNGSCEAGVGSIKARARDFAARRGAVALSCEDLELAREQANVGTAVLEPGGARLGVLRERTWSTYRARFESACKKRGIALGAPLPHAEQASLDRYAVREALTEVGVLTIRRRDFRC